MTKQENVKILGHWKSVEGKNIYENSYLKAMDYCLNQNLFLTLRLHMLQ